MHEKTYEIFLHINKTFVFRFFLSKHMKKFLLNLGKITYFYSFHGCLVSFLCKNQLLYVRILKTNDEVLLFDTPVMQCEDNGHKPVLKSVTIIFLLRNERSKDLFYLHLFKHNKKEQTNLSHECVPMTQSTEQHKIHFKLDYSLLSVSFI